MTYRPIRLERGATFPARYAGRCLRCDRPFDVGHQVVLFADLRAGHRTYVHPACAPPSRPGQPHCHVCLTALHQRETWDVGGRRRIPVGHPSCPNCLTRSTP